MKSYLNLLKISSKNPHSGYTLVELILASVVTVLVISAAGMGVVFMTQKNMIASADGDIKYNLGRAVDFMSEEIKTASSVATGVAIPTGTCGSDAGTTSTLRVTIPFTATSGSSSGTSSPYSVYYYTKAPGSPWLGSNAIYRCGPNLNADGTIATDSITGLPGTSSGQMLVDLIASGKEPNDGGCTGAYPSANVGFFVCVNGKMVEIHAAASAQNNTVSNPLSWGSGSGGGYAASGEPTYGIITQAYARVSP
jgi:Tfp pilus assembly protein PilW